MTAGRVRATLGEPAESVAADRRSLQAVRGATTIQNGYTVHELHSAPVIVREYVSANGVVFGVAWKGLVHPDLTQLLGSYSGEYQEALRQLSRKQGRRQLRVKTDRIVVEKWGHMRNLQGRAYVPALIPSGMRVDEIR